MPELEGPGISPCISQYFSARGAGISPDGPTKFGFLTGMRRKDEYGVPIFLRFYLFIWHRGRESTSRGNGRWRSRLLAEQGAWCRPWTQDLGIMTWTVDRHLTDWATQARLSICSEKMKSHTHSCPQSMMLFFLPYLVLHLPTVLKMFPEVSLQVTQVRSQNFLFYPQLIVIWGLNWLFKPHKAFSLMLNMVQS